MIILMLVDYGKFILFRLENIVDQNSKIIEINNITNELLTRLILGYFSIKLIKYSFKTLNYFFFYPDPHKPYS